MTSMFGSPKAPSIPEIEVQPTVEMPDEDAIAKEKRRKAAASAASTGRQSTFLSKPADASAKSNTFGG